MASETETTTTLRVVESIDRDTFNKGALSVKYVTIELPAGTKIERDPIAKRIEIAATIGR